MKVMKKKIIGLLVCMLMMTTIPLAAGAIEEKQEAEPKEVFDRVLVAGVFFRLNRVGDWYHGQVMRMRWYELSPGDRAGGITSFPDMVVFKEAIGSFYRIFQFGLGMFTFVVGILKNFEVY